MAKFKNALTEFRTTNGELDLSITNAIGVAGFSLVSLTTYLEYQSMTSLLCWLTTSRQDSTMRQQESLYKPYSILLAVKVIKRNLKEIKE